MKHLLQYNYLPKKAAAASKLAAELLLFRRQKFHNCSCLFLLSALLLLCPGLIQAQNIYSSSILLTSQEDVDEFGTHNYTEVTGSVDISGSDITDLSPLKSLTKVGRYLTINFNPTLSSLTGLENLTSVGINLYIRFNPILNSLAGLAKLKSVSGSLHISSNSSLSSLAGLENLTSVGGYLFIGGNANLSSLAGLENLTTVVGDLFITNNSQLSACCILLSVIKATQGAVTISGNASGCMSEDDIEEDCAPMITTQPESVELCIGEKATFSVEATDTELSYQWQKDEEPIEGAISKSYTIEAVSLSDAGAYTVVVTGTYSSVTSQEANLTVTSDPIVDTQPVAATKCTGEEVSFTASAGGTPVPTVQWQESSDGSNFSDIAGATATTYSFIATADKNGYQYRAIFSNSCGSTPSIAASLTVTSDPIVDIQLIATSDVYTGGDPNKIYLGYGGQSVKLQASGGQQYEWSPSRGLNNASIADPIFTPTQEGTYTFTVTVTNGNGCQTTASVTITVIDVRSGKNKVEICHKGKILSINPTSVQDHLAHGDQLGACRLSLTARYSNETADKVSDEIAEKPAATLLRSFPNAFSETTTIEFSFAQDEQYSLMIYDSHGRVVEHLQQGKAKAGELLQLEWNAGNLPAGTYLLRLSTHKQVESVKLLLE